MRLDHIAYRVRDREKAYQFFKSNLGYEKSKKVPEGFEIQFSDGSHAQCLVLEPPENLSQSDKRTFSTSQLPSIEFHMAPEIFVSDGSSNSIVSNWVETNGPGIHHIAYEVDCVETKMKEWSKSGIQFSSSDPLRCPGLVQVFTKPHPVTGIIYELIERTTQGFCKDNVKDLMLSTKEKK